MTTTTQARTIEREVWTAMARVRHRRTIVLALVTLGLLTATAAVMLAVGVVTLFRARRFYTEVMTRGLARAILRLWGIGVVVYQDAPFPTRQTIYVSNHTSTVDLFVLTALGLPNARFFLSGFLRKIVPLGVISTLMGTFHTPLQIYPERRVRCFQRAERILRRTGESVYLSPEGERITTGHIGPFNKGAFHLATALQVPIVPMYIHVPREVDPGKGLDARPGAVQVYVGPPIPTQGWRVEDLDRNRARVRARFVSFERHVRDDPDWVADHLAAAWEASPA